MPPIPDKIKPILALVIQTIQEKATAKITICIHQGGIRDLSIDKKVDLAQIKT